MKTGGMTITCIINCNRKKIEHKTWADMAEVICGMFKNSFKDVEILTL